jgi:hypothetical protein
MSDHGSPEFASTPWLPCAARDFSIGHGQWRTRASASAPGYATSAMTNRWGAITSQPMCGRVIRSSGPLRYAIVEGMNVRDSRVHNYPPRWNAAPSQELLVIRRNHKTGEVTLDPLRWGLIPYWCKDPKGGRKPINATCGTCRRSGTPIASAAASCRWTASLSGRKTPRPGSGEGQVCFEKPLGKGLHWSGQTAEKFTG